MIEGRILIGSVGGRIHGYLFCWETRDCGKMLLKSIRYKGPEGASIHTGARKIRIK
jgi:hypothetical protein